VLTPANHYLSRLPSLPGVGVYKLVTPRLAPARFGQYLLEVPAGGARCPLAPEHEHFVFGLEGDASVAGDEGDFRLGAGGFAYIPSGTSFRLDVPGVARLLWLKRPYEAWPGLGVPAAHGGHLDAVAATATAVPGLVRRELIDPFDPAFDFNMSLMSFEPGVGLPQIEIHDEEHGLYMTAGGGDYHLDGEQRLVEAGDFIYMAPYCPQGFVAGPDGGSYLLYKDVYRDGF
jgi:(S)-ureidoglycine aminohydrolase